MAGKTRFIKIILSRNNFIYKFFTFIVLFAFTLCSIIVPGVFASNPLHLPEPGAIVSTSPIFIPMSLRGIIVNLDDPFEFNFILESGDESSAEHDFNQQAQKLIRYFLASLTLPEEDLWVNLSPYEQDRIISESFGQTEMGIDLLAQDYLLKQITASLINPDEDLGKEFWKNIYKKSYQKYGTTDIDVDTFNKVWIMPEKAVIYENENRMFIVESSLKVLLEQDYLAQQSHYSGFLAEKKIYEPTVGSQEVTSSIMRDIIIPELEREVNFGKNFANLRQIYHSLILATWFKETLKDSILDRLYSDQGKIKGLENSDHQESSQSLVDKIYSQYLEAYRTGVVDMLRVEYDPYLSRNIPRKYFSGGINFKWEGTKEIFVKIPKDGSQKRSLANLRGIFKEILVRLGLYADKEEERKPYDMIYLSGEIPLFLSKTNDPEIFRNIVNSIQWQIRNPNFESDFQYGEKTIDGRINLDKLIALIDGYKKVQADPSYRQSYSEEFISQILTYLEFVLRFKQTHNIEITDHFPYEFIKDMSRAFDRLPEEIAHAVGAPLEVRHVLDDVDGGGAGIRTIHPIFLNSNFESLEFLFYSIFHEFFHKFSMSRNKAGHPILSLSVWKGIARSLGFSKVILTDKGEEKVVSLDDLPDDFSRFRAIQYGRWILQDSQGEFAVYFSDEEAIDLSDEEIEFYRQNNIQVRAYKGEGFSEREYWRTTPFEAVAEIGARLLMGYSIPDELLEAKKILEDTLLVVVDSQEKAYRYRYWVEGEEKFLDPIGDIEIELLKEKYPTQWKIQTEAVVDNAQVSDVGRDDSIGFIDLKIGPREVRALVLFEDKGKIEKLLEKNIPLKYSITEEGYKIEPFNRLNEKWIYLDTPLKMVNLSFRKDIVKEIMKFLDDNPERKFRLLDWGCGRLVGQGSFLIDLLSELKKHNIDHRVELIGFANAVYPEWDKTDAAIDLFWGDSSQLFAFLEERPVDMIVSMNGIDYTGLDPLRGNIKSKSKFINYLLNIFTTLREGGRIFLTHGLFGVDFFQQNFEEIEFLKDFFSIKSFPGSTAAILTRMNNLDEEQNLDKEQIPFSSNDRKGGIDFTPGGLEIQRQSETSGVQLNIQDFWDLEIHGVYPIIINITPISNLILLLGAIDDHSDKNLSLAY